MRLTKAETRPRGIVLERQLARSFAERVSAFLKQNVVFLCKRRLLSSFGAKPSLGMSFKHLLKHSNLAENLRRIGED